MSEESRLARVATRQAGAFHRRQALAAGYTEHQIEHRIANSSWMVELPSVYRAATSPATRETMRWAAVLWAPRSLLSHHTAAEKWAFDAVAASSKPHLLVPGASRRRCERVVVHRSDVPSRADRRFCDGLPFTSPELTIVQLAPLLRAEALESAFESGRRNRLLTAESLERCLVRIAAKGRPGCAAVRVLLREIANDPPCESVLEVKVARLLRSARVPKPVRQLEIDGYRVDFAWPEMRVVLECDGRRTHSNADDFQRDRTKWSALAAGGWRVVVVTWNDANRVPETIVTRIKQALAYAA
jgi:very-short-patch-repair endonuclease